MMTGGRRREQRPVSRGRKDMAATIDDYRWLVSDAAAPWLTIARNARAGYRGLRSKAQPGAAAVQLLTRLRKDLSAERAHLIIEQLELRQRAREKFSWAD